MLMRLKLLFSRCLPVCMAAIAALSASAHSFVQDGIYYNYLGNNQVEVTFEGTDYTKNPDRYTGAIEIPSHVVQSGTEFTVASIGANAFNGCTNLTSIILPETIGEISIQAFEGCSGLTAVQIPEGVTTLETNAFAECTRLASVSLPSTLTSVGP